MNYNSCCRKIIPVLLTALFMIALLWMPVFAAAERDSDPETTSQTNASEGAQSSAGRSALLHAAEDTQADASNEAKPQSGASETQSGACENHVWDQGVVTKKPTYSEYGSKEFTCTVCGEVRTEKIAKLKAYSKWIKYKGKWRYYDKNGKCVKKISLKTKNKWVKAGGKRFYFGKKKRPYGKGFHMIRNKLYYMGADKALVKGSFTVGGEKIKTTKKGNITGLPYYKRKYKRFVLIDISDQRLSYYKGKKLKLKCPVVTGNHSRGWDTPTGFFRIRHKSKDTYLINGSTRTYVAYWMAFIRNEYGIHDASWRGAKDFKNRKTYKKHGSHGCVNLRRKDAAKLYSMLPMGTRVIIQK